MKSLLVVIGMLLATSSASAQITLQEAQAEADTWVSTRWTTIKDRVKTCVTEGDPSLCHTAWAATTTPNTAPTDSALATVTLDDPGRLVTGPCDTCYTGEGTFAAAGISIPATAPLNAKINIGKSTSGRGEQLVIEIQYDGEKYWKAWGDAILPGFDWRVLE